MGYARKIDYNTLDIFASTFPTEVPDEDKQ